MPFKRQKLHFSGGGGGRRTGAFTVVIRYKHETLVSEESGPWLKPAIPDTNAETLYTFSSYPHLQCWKLQLCTLLIWVGVSQMLLSEIMGVKNCCRRAWIAISLLLESLILLNYRACSSVCWRGRGRALEPSLTTVDCLTFVYHWVCVYYCIERGEAG